ncbi:MAG TPA: glycosyltransferase family 4 protein, partial [Flavobacteriales bacterium]|nr:glycosyltransferase family 4 protein [Flavobacteriales bacterium]
DLWPESAVKLGLVKNKMLIDMSTALEMRCYRKAALITGQTQGIVSDIQRRCPDKRVHWMPNGIDLVDVELALRTCDRAKEREALGLAENDLALFYAGIIGHAQGLVTVLHAAERLKAEKHIRFFLIGDGPVRAELEHTAASLGLTNLRFIDGVDRASLLRMIAALDAAVVPLRRTDLFKGAIPSKIFEALALSKPLLLGVEGEAHELFIEQAEAGLDFTPEDDEQLAAAALRYHRDRQLMKTHGENGARYVRQRFDREAIGDALWKELQVITAGYV